MDCSMVSSTEVIDSHEEFKSPENTVVISGSYGSVITKKSFDANDPSSVAFKVFRSHVGELSVGMVRELAVHALLAEQLDDCENSGLVVARECLMMRNPYTQRLLEGHRAASGGSSGEDRKMPTPAVLLMPRFQCTGHTLAGRLSMADVQFVLRKCLQGLAKLHCMGLLHRDIKPANILIKLDSRRRKVVDAVLCDYGLVKADCMRGASAAPLAPPPLAPPPLAAPPLAAPSAAPPQQCFLMTGEVYTDPYRPPEVLLRDRPYSFPADIWALGMSVLHMASGHFIHWTRDELEIADYVFAIFGTPETQQAAGISTYDPSRYRKRSRCGGDRMVDGEREAALHQWLGCMASSRSAKSLIMDMLAVNPGHRITALQALEHPFFSELRAAHHPMTRRSHHQLRAAHHPGSPPPHPPAAATSFFSSARFPQTLWRTKDVVLTLPRPEDLAHLRSMVEDGQVSLSAAYLALELALGRERFVEAIESDVGKHFASAHDLVFPACLSIANSLCDTETIPLKDIVPARIEKTVSPRLLMFGIHAILAATSCSLFRSTLANYAPEDPHDAKVHSQLLWSIMDSAVSCPGVRGHVAAMALVRFVSHAADDVSPSSSFSSTKVSFLAHVSLALALIPKGSSSLGALWARYLRLREEAFSGTCASVQAAITSMRGPEAASRGSPLAPPCS
jgi:serine/threonine protein kinase